MFFPDTSALRREQEEGSKECTFKRGRNLNRVPEKFFRSNVSFLGVRRGSHQKDRIHSSGTPHDSTRHCPGDVHSQTRRQPSCCAGHCSKNCRTCSKFATLIGLQKGKRRPRESQVACPRPRWASTRARLPECAHRRRSNQGNSSLAHSQGAKATTSTFSPCVSITC